MGWSQRYRPPSIQPAPFIKGQKEGNKFMEEEKEQLKPKVRDLRNGDWLWINKLILDHPYLTSSTKIVYSALAYFADNINQKAYPSFETLSKLTGLNRSTVIRSLKGLEEYHFIDIEKKDGKTNRYILLKLTDSKPVAKCDPSKAKELFIPGIGVVPNKDWGVANKHHGGGK